MILSCRVDGYLEGERGQVNVCDDVVFIYRRKEWDLLLRGATTRSGEELTPDDSTSVTSWGVEYHI